MNLMIEKDRSAAEDERENNKDIHFEPSFLNRRILKA